MSRGGARKGSGRKPIGEKPKVQYATKLSVLTVSYLRQLDNASQSIELAITRSADFKRWSKK